MLKTYYKAEHSIICPEYRRNSQVSVMPQADAQSHNKDMQSMFTQIAPYYDLMNCLMTFGQDRRWRNEVIRRAELPAKGKILDLGAGTGDLVRQAVHQYPNCSAMATDLTLEMMNIGRQRQPKFAEKISWSAANAEELPFPDQTFDAVVSGFLLRNVHNLTRVLREQFRVLKPGGKIVALDTTPPALSILTPLIRIHMHTIIPTLGRWLTGQAAAYRYLPESSENFLAPEQLTTRLAEAGFHGIDFQRRMFGTIAIYWGTK